MALDETAKARIKGHMNKEHGAELSQYLRAFNGLSSRAASNAQIADMTLDSLTITSKSGTHAVAITPPLASLSEARVRLVDMAQRAQAKLGLSDIRIDTFTLPKGGGWVSLTGVTFYFICAIAVGLDVMRPGTAAWNTLQNVHSEAPSGFVWLVKTIFIPVLVIHVTEAWMMARTRLYKHGVAQGSTSWCLWVANTFLEGYPAFMRFDGLVEAERKKKDSAKH
ncbi:hypothetical protein F5Y15DRAFT_350610 [Xylariaceae sp. FL0016]|nr:hypothetical protein F5Y15DRAFT_350610 [Xylariaceae sp. FL0016]